jgi:hypothetical protein
VTVDPDFPLDPLPFIVFDKDLVSAAEGHQFFLCEPSFHTATFHIGVRERSLVAGYDFEPAPGVLNATLVLKRFLSDLPAMALLSEPRDPLHIIDLS